MKKQFSRRQFLGNAIKGAASTACLTAFGPLSSYLKAATSWIDPRVGMPNPYVNGLNQPILVSVTGTDFETMLAAGLAEIGGLNLLINDNQDVLIKPNLLTPDELYPTTSDLNSVLSMISAIQAVSSGSVYIGDCGVASASSTYRRLGFDPAIPEAGGILLTFDDTYEVRRDTWGPEIPDFLVFQDVYDAPIIINFPTLKRHNSSQMTCAIKNHVGIVDGSNMTGTRLYLHTASPFYETLAEIAGCINSELHVVDARTIMALFGPYQSWGGELRDLDKLVICGDIVATDTYCANLLAEIDGTFDPASIQPTLQRAEELGMGTADLSQVDIRTIDVTAVGGPSGSSNPTNFQLHQNHPNPFNFETTISFTLPKDTPVELTVHDISGRKITSLINDWKPSGEHSVVFKAGGLSSGNYVYKLKTAELSLSGRMTFLK